jgi:hypothetical protein
MTRSHANVAKDKRFSEMNGREKLAFIGKLVLMLASFGFVYPNLLD